MVQGVLGQNTLNNGITPTTSQHKPLGQNTTEQVLAVDRNDNENQVQQTNQTSHNTPVGVLPNASQKPKVSGQTTQSRVLPKCTDTGEKWKDIVSCSLKLFFFFFSGNEI